MHWDALLGGFPTSSLATLVCEITQTPSVLEAQVRDRRANLAAIKCSLAVTRGRLNITGCTGREKVPLVFVIEVTVTEVLAERGQQFRLKQPTINTSLVAGSPADVGTRQGLRCRRSRVGADHEEGACEGRRAVHQSGLEGDEVSEIELELAVAHTHGSPSGQYVQRGA
jgi:hypothetical protein